MRRRPAPPAPLSGLLGIEAGATRTTARWESDDATQALEQVFPAANLQLLDDPTLVARLSEIGRRFPHPRALALGMAGTRTPADRERLQRAIARVWPSIPCHATHDLDLALAADDAADAADAARADAPRPHVPTVLVLSGTGSCCYGRSRQGETVKVGGWGHWLGDEGSGFDLALRALRGVVRELDQRQRWGPLGVNLLAHLQLNHPDALIPWMGQAAKSDVAALAPVVLDAAATDPLARAVVHDSAQALALAAQACARRLGVLRGQVRFLLAGSVLLQSTRFARQLTGRLHTEFPQATVVRLARSGAVGAVRLARQLLPQPTPPLPPSRPPTTPPVPAARRSARPQRFVPDSTQLSPTEERNLRSMNLDQLDANDAIELMLSEDERIPAALRQEKKAIAKALRLTVSALNGGGRLFYVGAGTSGRLGILDASECPPTFRTPPELVQGIIAGGEPAIFRSVEGAEDDFDGGVDAVRHRGVNRKDFVLGIAASGRTPFVWGALAEARRRGAKTGLLCFNPFLRIPSAHRPDVQVTPRIGPEVLTGSTRLKAGTATKLFLNLLTTLAMVRLGKVARNLMIDVNPANEKLRGRAVRIVRELTGVEEASVASVLEREGWVVQRALRRLGWRG